MLSPRIVAIALVLTSTIPAFAAEAVMPSDADVRKVIEKSLPFVEKDGLAWIRNRNCMSCHTVTFMLWAHNEAASVGIDVDQAKLKEWTQWSRKKSLDSRVFYKLDAKTIEKLPDDVQKQLGKVLDTGFTHEADYVAALAKSLDAETLKKYQAELIKLGKAAKKVEGNDGGGLETLAQLFLTPDANAESRDKDFDTSTMDLIVRLQGGSGIWNAGGQLPARKWSKTAADQTSTIWTILALSAYREPSATVQKSLDKAHAAVKKPTPDPNFEWIIARTLYEYKFGTPDQQKAMKEALLKRQNNDGGWSALPEGKSEAFSTGQAIYTLRVIGMEASDPVIGRGRKYLVDSMDKDGFWLVSPALTSNGDAGRHKKLEPIWRNWGTSWAVIGLAKTLPKK